MAPRCRKAYFRKYYVEHREKKLAYKRAYAQTPKGRAVKVASDHRRRARKTSSVPPGIHISGGIIQSLKSLGQTCPICKRPYDTSSHRPSIDHILPLSRGGLHTPDNLATICLHCNLRKGARTLGEFLDNLLLVDIRS